MRIPIVVAAYDRPAALQRLLISLEKASYSDPVTLIISIDGGGDKRVREIAEGFQWPFGKKEIIHHKENYGLRRHILSCGDISFDYDGIILLEDDLYVSPQFHNYALSAIRYYHEDDSISGIALYSHGFNETAAFPFYPLLDGSDVFFMQLACSWGQCWTKKQWRLFKNWLKNKGPYSPTGKFMLPGDITLWPESSWKKPFISYMIEKNLFFVFPRQSYTTNFGDAGAHFKGTENFQVPLQYGAKAPSFVKLSDSLAVYDAFCEILPYCLNRMCEHLNEYDYCVDLYGTKLKSNIAKEYLLTSKQSRKAIMKFGKTMRPLEANIIEKIEGNRLFFARTADCINNDCFFDQRRQFLNSKEEVLYHYNIPQRHIEKSIIPNGFRPAFLREIMKRVRYFLK